MTDAMSRGGRIPDVPFNKQKFFVMADYFWRYGGVDMQALKLSWLMFNSDFSAFQRLGAPMTGATYVKGYEHPEVREMGWGWFERYSLLRQSLWLTIPARIFALTAAIRFARGKA